MAKNLEFMNYVFTAPYGIDTSRDLSMVIAENGSISSCQLLSLVALQIGKIGMNDRYGVTKVADYAQHFYEELLKM